jgi:hypothetical protein
MLRQQAVIVGDVDDILQVLDKQKVSYSSNLSHYVWVKERPLHVVACSLKGYIILLGGVTQMDESTWSKDAQR